MSIYHTWVCLKWTATAPKRNNNEMNHSAHIRTPYVTTDPQDTNKKDIIWWTVKGLLLPSTYTYRLCWAWHYYHHGPGSTAEERLNRSLHISTLEKKKSTFWLTSQVSLFRMARWSPMVGGHSRSPTYASMIVSCFHSRLPWDICLWVLHICGGTIPILWNLEATLTEYCFEAHHLQWKVGL